MGTDYATEPPDSRFERLNGSPYWALALQWYNRARPYAECATRVADIARRRWDWYRRRWAVAPLEWDPV
jgi:hypothetical protein